MGDTAPPWNQSSRPRASPSTSARSRRSPGSTSTRLRLGARGPRPQRRRQDHLRPHDRHAHPAGRRHAARRGDRRRRDPEHVRRVIGLAGQTAAVEPALTGRENLRMVARLFGHDRARGRRRGRRGARAARPHRRRRPARAHLLRRHAAAARPRREPRRRAAPAAPRRADDRSRPAQPQRAVARRSRRSSTGGTDVLLTTQYLDEADRLADHDRDHRPRPARRVGHAATSSSRSVGRDVIDVRVRDDADLERAARRSAPRRPSTRRARASSLPGDRRRRRARRRGPGARRRRHRARRHLAAPPDARRRVPHAHRPHHRGSRPTERGPVA